ncbi:M28 family peptidase [Candidatus Poribacteria bacterium]|nr:M28 family peptidase [Candidatus Poribacteria bacterium]
MEKRWLVALLMSLHCGVFGIACAGPDSDNRSIGLKDSARESVSTAREANAVFDAHRAFNMLEKQCAFGPRPPGSVSHTETRDFLFTELQKYANSVALQPLQYKTKTGTTLHLNNILAEFGPPAGGEALLLAAHWDTRPFADRDPKPENQDKPILGANDGASGVAVLLEIARVLKEHPPPRRVVIVLFDGEDYGRSVEDMFIGSRFFARNLGKWKPDYGILLDMIGDKDLALPIERYSWNANRGFAEAIWRRAATLGLAPFQSRLGDAILDDHVPLIEVGIPMVNIIDFTYPYWHTIEDTVDKCSAKSLEVVATLVISIIYDGL